MINSAKRSWRPLAMKRGLNHHIASGHPLVSGCLSGWSGSSPSNTRTGGWSASRPPVIGLERWVSSNKYGLSASPLGLSDLVWSAQRPENPLGCLCVRMGPFEFPANPSVFTLAFLWFCAPSCYDRCPGICRGKTNGLSKRLRDIVWGRESQNLSTLRISSGSRRLNGAYKSQGSGLTGKKDFSNACDRRDSLTDGGLSFCDIGACIQYLAHLV